MTGKNVSETSEFGMDVICRFAGHLAHELNNLLTPIIACGQMLKDGLDKDDPQYFCAEQVFEAGERCLEFSRKLQVIGSRGSNNRTIELASYVHEIAKSVSLPAEKGVRLELLDSELPSEGGEELLVSVDTEQMVFLITEMMNNASTFMPNGGTIRISLSGQKTLEGHEGDGWVCLTVKDDGTGIDEATKARMYEPFFSTLGKERDKGLGLTLVYGIIRRAGGVIQCDSAPGEGAAFHIYFPRAAHA